MKRNKKKKGGANPAAAGGVGAAPTGMKISFKPGELKQTTDKVVAEQVRRCAYPIQIL